MQQQPQRRRTSSDAASSTATSPNAMSWLVCGVQIIGNRAFRGGVLVGKAWRVAVQQPPFPALPTQHAAATLQADAAPVAPNPPPTHLHHLQHAHAAGAARRDEERQQQRGLHLRQAMQCNAMRECHEGELHMRRGCALLRAAASVMVCAAATGPLLLAPLQGTAARAPQATPAKPGDVPGTAAPPPCEGTAAWRTAARCSTSPAAVVRVGGAGKAAGQARCSSSSSCTLQHISGCSCEGWWGRQGSRSGQVQQQ